MRRWGFGVIDAILIAAIAVLVVTLWVIEFPLAFDDGCHWLHQRWGYWSHGNF